jgi:hypothetical protein
VGHAKRIMRVWGYLKAHPSMGIKLDPSSSYGSELRAMAATAVELRGYRMFLRGIGIPIKGPSLLFVDNAAALFAASKLATTLKVKHLSIDYHAVRELTAWGVIRPEKVPSAQNLSDVLTKPTSRATFWSLINRLMIGPLRKGAGVVIQMMSLKD